MFPPPNKRYPKKEVNVQLLLCLIKQHIMTECKEMDALFHTLRFTTIITKISLLILNQNHPVNNLLPSDPS